MAETPLETYEKRLRARIKIELRPGESGSGDGYSQLVTVGEKMCDVMTTSAEGGDGPNASPEGDAMMYEFGATFAVDLAIETLGDQELAATFLRTTTRYLCPDHTKAVEAVLDTRDI